jgi:hypothetical protein
MFSVNFIRSFILVLLPQLNQDYPHNSIETINEPLNAIYQCNNYLKKDKTKLFKALFFDYYNF